MAHRVMIFAGAPDNATLDWEVEGLLQDFLEPLARFAGIYEPQPSATSPEQTVLDMAIWRSIPLERASLGTGFSQNHEFNGYYQGDQNFFSTAETQDTDTASQSLQEEFYEHSLRIHDDMPSSQLPTATFSSTASSYESTHGESFVSSIGDSTFLAQEDRTLGIGTAHLSDLEDLPNAAYLKKIEPQTMTVNLIAGIISISEPRVVKTRWASSKSLIELVVGDETKSGFSITFWISGDTRSLADVTLKNLRRQDIILLRNVALSHFNNKVHGHSLRKGLTRIDLLYRRKLDEGDVRGFYSAKELASREQGRPQLRKTQKVREWVLQFVAGGRESQLGKRKAGGKTIRSWELPPPDTQ